MISFLGNDPDVIIIFYGASDFIDSKAILGDRHINLKKLFSLQNP